MISPSVSSGIEVGSRSCSLGVDGGGVGEVEAGEETAGRVVPVCDESKTTEYNIIIIVAVIKVHNL